MRDGGGLEIRIARRRAKMNDFDPSMMMNPGPGRGAEDDRLNPLTRRPMWDETAGRLPQSATGSGSIAEGGRRRRQSASGGGRATGEPTKRRRTRSASKMSQAERRGGLDSWTERKRDGSREVIAGPSSKRPRNLRKTKDAARARARRERRRG